MARRPIAPGTRGPVGLTGQWLDSSGAWRNYADQPDKLDREGQPMRVLPRKWEQVKRWRIRFRYADHSGKVSDLTRYLPGELPKHAVVAASERLADEALAAALGPVAVPVEAGDVSLIDAGKAWLDLIDRKDSRKSERTRHEYRASFDRFIDAEGSTLRDLSLTEANRVPLLRSYLQGIADAHGTGSARMVRNVLSGIIGQAVTDEALATNALRSIKPVQQRDGLSLQRRKAEEDRNTERALTRAERDALIAYADARAASTAWKRSQLKAVGAADLLAFMAGTGVRIGEALGLRWEHVELDQGPAGRVTVHGTKSAASFRSLDLPEWLGERLRLVREEARTGYVFPAPSLGDPERKWDQANAQGALAAVLLGAGHGWASPHTLRRTVATLLHEAGVPLVQIAGQLGHSDPSMTATKYLWDSSHSDKSALAAVL